MNNKISELRERINYCMEDLKIDITELNEINRILEELENGEIGINEIDFVDESLKLIEMSLEILETIHINEFENNNPEWDAIRLFCD